MTGSTKKVALVTGAATGIGCAIAIRLAHDGIVNCMRAPTETDEVVYEIREASGTA